MVNETTSRALLYGSALLVVGGLCAGAMFFRPSADLQTLLSSADVQLRMAYAIPAKDAAGVPLPAREEMIADAERNLAAAERLQPGMAVTAEFRGFVHMLRGRHKAAAEAYGQARNCQDATAEQRDVLAFNEARMLAAAGEIDAALATYERHATALDARYGQQRRIEEAGVLRQAGRTKDAEVRLDAAAATAGIEDFAWLQIGREYLELGAHGKAETALRRVAGAVPLANYYLARLKLATGEVDTALALLETAVAAVPGDARRLLREEAATWRGIADDPRFEQLHAPRAATPGR